ncbi:MAG: hypothetical protein FWH27_10330 [Planctomycetaceae bacterium]|nr:hypothetical protein [Planctomycetaceae bacterium]
MIKQFRVLPYFATFLLIGVAFCSFGCSRGPKKPDGMPQLYLTEITVNSESGLVDDAIVSLYPADGSRTQWSSGARTNAQGVARIKTHGQFDGAPEGKYKVVVKKTVAEGEAPPPMGVDAESQRIYDEYMSSGNTQKLFRVVDSQFDSAKTTPLEIEVSPQKLNASSVDIGATVKVEIKSTSATAN